MSARDRSWMDVLLALSPHLLALLGLVALLLRAGQERLQVLPALLIGMGLVMLSTVRRRRRRRELLSALRQQRGLQNHGAQGSSVGS
jgi:hypothetical protein